MLNFKKFDSAIINFFCTQKVGRNKKNKEINKGDFNKNIRWSVLNTAHLTRHVILVWNKYRWAGQLKFETK